MGYGPGQIATNPIATMKNNFKIGDLITSIIDSSCGALFKGKIYEVNGILYDYVRVIKNSGETTSWWHFKLFKLHNSITVQIPGLTFNPIEDLKLQYNLVPDEKASIQICTCDFYTVVLPYGCKCGGE